jgi:hypothetical protein
VSEREPLPRTADEKAEDDYWERLYGDWDCLDPAGMREFFDGFDRPWWVVGGWAIEAFTFEHGTGAPREHEDVDVSILGCDVPALRAHVGESWQLWNIADGAIRPLTDHWPDVQHPESQIWGRRDAASPWAFDMPLTPDRDGLWTNKKLSGHVAPIEEVTWVAGDGIRYLNPEIVLMFKARLGRLKDDRDLDRCLPLLTGPARSWLAESVARLFPDHVWLDRLR